MLKNPNKSRIELLSKVISDNAFDIIKIVNCANLEQKDINALS